MFVRTGASRRTASALPFFTFKPGYEHISAHFPLLLFKIHAVYMDMIRDIGLSGVRTM